MLSIGLLQEVFLIDPMTGDRVVRKSGHEERLHLGMLEHQTLGQFSTTDFRHGEMADREVDLSMMLLSHQQGLHGRSRLQHMVPMTLQRG